MSDPLKEQPGSKKTEKTMFLIVKDGCQPCPEYEKLVTEAVPKDVKIKEVKLGQNADVDSLVTNVLGVQQTPTAIYVEDYRIRGVLKPTGKTESDRDAIANVQNAGGVQGKDVALGCAATFDANDEAWKVKLNGGKECEKAVDIAASLNRGSRKNLSVHLSSDDPKLAEILKKLGDKP